MNVLLLILFLTIWVGIVVFSYGVMLLVQGVLRTERRREQRETTRFQRAVIREIARRR